MSGCEDQSCAEYRRLTRRQFVGAASASAAALAAHAWLPRVTLAKDYRSSQRDVMIHVFLRGGADGLSVCAPFGDPAYYTSRPKLAIPRPDSGAANRCVALDSFFGVSQAWAPLMPVYQAGKLLFVHACGSQDDSRSHFKQQRWMEAGKLNDLKVSTGWLGRHLAGVPAASPGSLLRAVAISDSLPRAMLGAPAAVPTTPFPENFGLPGGLSAPAREAALRAMYAAAPEPLASTAVSTFDTIALLRSINFTGYVPAGGAVYGTDTFSHGMRAAAALAKAEIGIEAISLDLFGWDTHFDQGPSSPSGLMYKVMSTLASAMAAFFTDMTSGPAPTFTVACMSEFGRRVAENDSIGTDHGHGGVMMLMGNAVNGGRVLANWPGLGAGQLYQGIDLAVTTDYRDVLAEVLVKRMGATNLGLIFPDHVPTFLGVVT
jgi:uncharacterized protein (DUF1501 family)